MDNEGNNIDNMQDGLRDESWREGELLISERTFMGSECGYKRVQEYR